jgi:dihydroorotase
MATVRPATVINRVPNLGTLSLGAPADVTVLEMVNKPSVFIDTMENERPGDRHLRPVAVVRAGRWMA